MLSLLLALAAPSAPTHLPLPSRPASLLVTNAPNLPPGSAGIQSGKNQSAPGELNYPNIASTEATTRDVSWNYQHWRECGGRWTKEEPRTAKLPTQARRINDRRHTDTGISLVHGVGDWVLREDGGPNLPWLRYRFLPWHTVYVESGLWPEDVTLCDTLWYRLIKRCTPSSPFYIVEVDGLPSLQIRAKSVEEMEKKLLERFAAFVESASESIPPPREYGYSGLNYADGFEHRFR